MSSELKGLIVTVIAVIIPLPMWSCTIFCAKDKHGHMWAGNNEDFYWFDFSTQIRVIPETDSTLSYLYFQYHNLNIPQGGVNEAGLFFDCNMVEAAEVRGGDKKINFPGETSAFMRYMLGRCKTVHDVLPLFKKYNIPELTNAQIHLADKAGNMGIVTADSAWLTSGDFQVSTNFNLGHNDDDYKNCWRYPIAYAMLSHAEPELQLMTRICDSTSQRKHVSTIYSNVHNLTTGEMWIYYAWDYENPCKTTFETLVALGDTVIMIRDLFPEQVMVKAYNAFTKTGFNAGLNILNTIDDPVLRAEKLKLLSQAALFDFDTFLETGKAVITKDNILVRQVIEATRNAETLSLIINQNVSKENKKLAERKLRRVQTSGISTFLIPALIAAVSITCILMFVRKSIGRWIGNRD